MAFTVSIFTKFTIAKLHFQKSCYNELYPNRSRSVQNKEKFSPTPLVGLNLISWDLQLLKTSHGYLLYRVWKTANKYEVTPINLFTSRSKYGYRCADSHETHANLATICEKSYTGLY